MKKLFKNLFVPFDYKAKRQELDNYDFEKSKDLRRREIELWDLEQRAELRAGLLKLKEDFIAEKAKYQREIDKLENKRETLSEIASAEEKDFEYYNDCLKEKYQALLKEKDETIASQKEYIKVLITKLEPAKVDLKDLNIKVNK